MEKHFFDYEDGDFAHTFSDNFSNRCKSVYLCYPKTEKEKDGEPTLKAVYYKKAKKFVSVQ